MTTREELEKQFGEVYDTKEVQEAFVVHQFVAPYVSVTRKSDGARGTLMFLHSPRFYFDFEQE